MLSHQDSSVTPPDAHDDAFDSVVDAFEAAWRSGQIPSLLAFLDAARDGTLRRALLHELLCIDMEYRWRREVTDTGGGVADRHCRTLEDYLAELPELQPLASRPIGVITEEYRVRRRWGDRPSVAEYVARFPERSQELTAALQEVDQDLEREADPPPGRGSDFKSADRLVFAGIPMFDHHDFILEAHLGSGGIGKVYRAWWKSRKHHIAFKMLRKRWWQQPGAEELFFREAAILMHLTHNNIVRMHGIGRTPAGGCFLVIDLIHGGDLAGRVGTPVSLAQALEWVAQAADALAFTHAQGVVHRDVKPSNLLLDQSGRIHVADFGLALTPAAGLDTAGHIVGTIAYMAPEQLFGEESRVGPCADIFSLGAVLYALLLGQPPYHGTSLLEIAHRRLVQPFVSPKAPAGIPPRAADVLSRCLAVDPHDRFCDANELAIALRNVLP